MGKDRFISDGQGAYNVSGTLSADEIVAKALKITAGRLRRNTIRKLGVALRILPTSHQGKVCLQQPSQAELTDMRIQIMDVG